MKMMTIFLVIMMMNMTYIWHTLHLEVPKMHSFSWNFSRLLIPIDFACFAFQYIRIAHDSDAEAVLKTVFEEEWKLKLPKLLISVTGGAKSFVLHPKLKQVLRQGLLKVGTERKGIIMFHNRWVCASCNDHFVYLIDWLIDWSTSWLTDWLTDD